MIIKRNIKLNYKNKIINAGNVTTFSQYSIVSKYNIVKKPINLKNNLAIFLDVVLQLDQEWYLMKLIQQKIQKFY